MSRTLLGQAPYDFGAVKAAYPLLEVVERVGVKLRRAGPSMFQGLCPFHEERTPSFTVYAEQQRFCVFWMQGEGRRTGFRAAPRAPRQRRRGLRLADRHTTTPSAEEI